jgi:hypothetical protein
MYLYTSSIFLAKKGISVIFRKVEQYHRTVFDDYEIQSRY